MLLFLLCNLTRAVDSISLIASVACAVVAPISVIAVSMDVTVMCTTEAFINICEG